MDNDPGRHPVDQHVGSRIRMLRKDAGMSQTNLADAIALTFQQVQKYEQGLNRVSASKLYEIAGVLGVSIATFFEGLPGPAGGSPLRGDHTRVGVSNLLETPEGETVALHFPDIVPRRVPRNLADGVFKGSEASNDRHSHGSNDGDQSLHK